MSFTKTFQHDIFLSYARVDNLSLSDSEGWVDIFTKALEYAIARKVGKSKLVKIWRDTREIDGSQLFDETIEKAIRDSAIILCLISPGYTKSDYCKKELSEFHRKSSEEDMGLHIEDRNRIFYLRLDKVDRKTLSELGRSTGFDIHDNNDPADHVDPYGLNDQNYNEVLKSLSNALIKTLSAISDLSETTQNASQNQNQPEKEEDKFSIFFADVPDNLSKLKYKTISNLKKKGYFVFENIPPPLEESEHDKAAAEQLKKADLSIHLLNETPGKPIVDIEENLCYPQKQIELGFTHSKNQMIWTPSEIDLSIIENKTYQQYLSDLEIKKERAYQFIKGRKSTLENDVNDLIDRIIEKKLNEEVLNKTNVLLDTHFKDQLFALDINSQLIQNNIQPYLNPQEDNPQSNLNLLAEMIKKVNKIVFIYGQISKEWVLERMSAALQLIVTNNFPVEDFVVFMVPPTKNPEDIKMRQKFMSVRIIDNSSSETIGKDSIERMLSELPGE